MKEMIGLESYSRTIQEAPDTLRGRYSSLPGVEKSDDLTWVDATINETGAEKIISYFFPIEDTFAMLKPDTQQIRDEILEEIRKNGFKVVAKKEIEILPEDIRVIYKSNVDKPYFDDIVRQLTSYVIFSNIIPSQYLSRPTNENHFLRGPLLALGLRAQDAVQKWKKLIGPTDPDIAVDSYPIEYV